MTKLSKRDKYNINLANEFITSLANEKEFEVIENNSQNLENLKE